MCISTLITLIVVLIDIAVATGISVIVLVCCVVVHFVTAHIVLPSLLSSRLFVVFGLFAGLRLCRADPYTRWCDSLITLIFTADLWGSFLVLGVYSRVCVCVCVVCVSVSVCQPCM